MVKVNINNTTTKPPPVIRKIEPAHSQEVHEILTKMPSWIIRWGITVLFLVVLALLTISWYIKYPDVVRTRVMIVTSEVPAGVMTRSNGALAIKVKEHEFVEEGDFLGYVKNPANFRDVMALKNQLSTLPNLKKLDEYWQLGELQPYFNGLVTSMKKSNNIQRGVKDDHTRKTVIKQQMEEFRSAYKNATKRLTLAQHEYDFAQKTLQKRHQVLFLEGVISEAEYEKHANELVHLNKAVEAAKTVRNDINNQLLVLKKETQNLDFNRGMESVDAQNEIEDVYSRLVSQMALWEQRYVLKAPQSGRIQYLDFAKENMFVQTDQEIARIIPNEEGQLYGEMFIPANGFGKVDTGQTVLIELDHYQKKEFGVIEGQVQLVADIGTEKGYKSVVRFKNHEKLMTTFNKELDFNYGMGGNAQIITEDIRLLHRFLYQLNAVFKEK